MTTRDWIIIAAAIGVVAFVWWYTRRKPKTGELPAATVREGVRASGNLLVDVGDAVTNTRVNLAPFTVPTNPYDDLSL